MKKSVLIALMLMGSLVSVSQTGIYSGGIGSHKPQELRKTGLIIRPEMGFAFWEEPFSDAFIPVAVNVGYQLSPRFLVGGGTAFYLDFTSSRQYNSETGISRLYRSWVIPIYANSRWYWYEDTSSPFLELNVGSVMFKKSWWDSKWEAGWYWQPAIGYDIKNFDIKIWTDLFYYKNYYYQWGFGFGLSLGCGFCMSN